MATRSGLFKKINEVAAANPGSDPKVLAAELRQGLTTEDFDRLLSIEIAHAQRRIASETEKESFKESLRERWPSPEEMSDGPGVDPHSPVDPLAPFRKLFGASFRLGDGNEVAWETATRQDHETRIAMLTKLRDGLDRTIERHWEAIRCIDGAGVTCLAEIEKKEAA